MPSTSSVKNEADRLARSTADADTATLSKIVYELARRVIELESDVSKQQRDISQLEHEVRALKRG